MRSKSVVEKIMGIDEEITQLVKKRSSLINTLRVKGYVPSEVEKALRQHWEQYASERTKDTAFVRSLFKILQQVEMQEAGELSPGKFILTPSKAKVNFTIQGTVQEELVHLLLLYSVVRRIPMLLTNVAISDSVFSTIKMLQSIGVGITWEKTTICTHSFAVDVNDIVVHLGDSAVSLYCLLALSVSYMGHSKCVGGLSLSMLSLSVCKDILVQCGVRVTSLGGVSGIPARIESTRQIPAVVTATSTTPKELILALLATIPACVDEATEEGFIFNFANHPHKEEIETIAKALYTALDCSYTYENYEFSFSKKDMEEAGNSIEQVDTGHRTHTTKVHGDKYSISPKIPLDPYHTFVRAIVPYFTGGSATIEGWYPTDSPIHKAVIQQLEELGMDVELLYEENAHSNAHSIAIQVCKKTSPKNINFNSLPQEYFPLLLVLFLSTIRTKGKGRLPELPENIDATEVASFLESLAIEEHEGMLIFSKEQSHLPWIAPNAYWIIAYAYSAFLFTGITLANPSDVTTILPNFWRFYNTFPIPIEYDQITLQEATTVTKRRLIVR